MRSQFRISDHAARRMAQRNVGVLDLGVALQFGRVVYAAGAEFHFLGRRDLPKGREREFERLVGLTAVVSEDTVITVYRNRNGFGKTRRKSKHFVPPRREPGHDVSSAEVRRRIRSQVEWREIAI